MRPIIILFTAFLTFSGGAFAFSMAGIIKQAEVIKVNAVTAATSTAITVSTTIRGFAANDPYQIKTLDVPKTTYMTRLKAGMGETGGLKGLVKRNAWYAGWFATMAAAGWAIDELTNQVTAPTMVTRGTCLKGSSTTLGTGKTLAECFTLLKAQYPISTGYYTSTQGDPVTAYVIHLTQGVNQPYLTNAGKLQYLNTSQEGASSVPDDAIYDSLITKMLQDPLAAAQAFMVPDAWPYPYPEVFPDTVPYIPGVTQSDQELLDLYAQGLLQSTNPNAAHYVSPEKYAEIAALAGQLQAGVTPQALVDAANQAAQSPVTQAQLEELMAKQEAAEAKADAAALEGAKAALAPATEALDQLNDEKTELEDMISDAPTAQPPSSIPDIFDWALPTGNCQPYPFTFTIHAGSAQADDNGAFCQTYNEVAHPLIFWFLNMLTAVYIFGIWSRTMTSVVGGR
ncbi:hypothetical protein [Aeromonas taiwanensis]|uniref:hypothetical protein n=1 Tax=Aeromonas taiwanensis TaxID=633417 RepID=UPI00248EE925|nr:hypothetical protein [Aeromonas taiwanensis]